MCVCVKMADNECIGAKSGGGIHLEMEKFTRKNSFDVECSKKRRNAQCECGKDSCLCCEKYKQCIVVMNGMNNNFKMIKAAKDGAKAVSGDGTLGPVNKRRTLRFDSSESSDSGVAALSNTDSSQSSGTSDITEPCSPPSPVSPPSCTLLPSDGDPLNGYDATSPPSCQGSYDSGLEEATASQSPSTPGQSSDDHGLEKDDGSPCPALEEDDSFAPLLHKEIVAAEPSSSEPHAFRMANGCDLETDAFDRFLPPPQSAVDCTVTSTTNHGEDLDPASWSHSSSHPPWETRSGVPTSTVSETDLLCPVAAGLNKIKADFGSSCAASQRLQRLPEGDPLLMCRWTKCCQVVSGGGDMIDHIRGCHVDAQVNSESFVCLWEGCKVYSKASCSLSWLERHVLVHSGNKPFKCIVDGCGQRFTSQNGLERHVNSHFNQPHSHNGNLSKRKDDSPSKMMKKKRLRYRRTCWTARTEDFFDAGIMECLRHRLVTLSDHTRLDVEGSSNAITFHSTVIARQVEVSGKARVLLHWVPENIIPDEWVCESQVVSHLKQTIPLSSLPRDTLAGIESLTTPVSRPYRKNRRK